MFKRKWHIEADNTIQLKEENDKSERIPEIITSYYSAAGNREYQQDMVYVSPGSKLAYNSKTRIIAVVCDGMGGMTDGGLASRTAVDTLVQGFEKIKDSEDVDIPLFFTRGIKFIDKKINSIPKVNGKGSGTTMVAVITEGEYLYWASVGDSRIYIFHNNQIIWKTTDHNYDLHLQKLVQSGQMTEEDKSKKQKEALISFLGIGNVSLMDISRQPYKMNCGDIVILCSDGVTKTLDDNQICAIIADDKKSIKEKAGILVEAAIRGNPFTQDNTSVAILQYIE